MNKNIGYFFVLGSNPTLSVAEISAFFGVDIERSDAMKLKSGVLIFFTKKEIDAAAVIKRLGGTIKIGKIETMTPSTRAEDILEKIIPTPPFAEGKYKFGISFYGRAKIDVKKLAMEMKKYLRARGISSRWVTSREPVLSSVVVAQNKLVEKAAETVFIADGNKLIIGKTLAVQPFKELSRRDYGRPARDDASGMLPPKLAIIMINLARVKPGSVILDPFCGSGTILSEAAIMGHKNLIGADISRKAAEDTKKNIAWTAEKLQVTGYKLRIINADASRLSKNIRARSVSAIITEPYLGPQRGKFDVSRIVNELEILYSDALAEFRKILKSNGRVVMAWPVFMKHGTYNTKHAERNMKPKTRNRVYINPGLHGFKIVNPIPDELLANSAIKLTARNTIIYGRPGQRVWREIVTLRN